MKNIWQNEKATKSQQNKNIEALLKSDACKGQHLEIQHKN